MSANLFLGAKHQDVEDSFIETIDFLECLWGSPHLEAGEGEALGEAIVVLYKLKERSLRNLKKMDEILEKRSQG